MRTFVDNAGRTWTVAISVYAVKRLRALLGIDLYGLVDDEFKGLGKLLSDPVSLVDMLYVLCQSEAEKLGVTDESFGRAMAGDAIERATEAFLTELTDFFPDARVRTGIAKVLTLGREVRDRMLSHAIEKMDEINPEDVARTLINSSGNSRGSSESTQARLRSVS